jgi:hypothetical protein
MAEVLTTPQGGNFDLLTSTGETVFVQTAPFTPSASSVGATFVFQPGGTAGGNVFTEWGDAATVGTLYHAIASTPGDVFVACDGTFSGGVGTVPAGNWELNLTHWSTVILDNEGFTLVFAAGAHVTLGGAGGTGSVFIGNGFEFAAGGAGLGDAPFAGAGGSFILSGGFLVGSADGAPLVHASNPNYGVNSIGGQIGDGTNAAIVVDAAVEIVIEENAQALIAASSLSGAGRVFVFFDDSSRVASSQPGLTTLTLSPQSAAVLASANFLQTINSGGELGPADTITQSAGSLTTQFGTSVRLCGVMSGTATTPGQNVQVTFQRDGVAIGPEVIVQASQIGGEPWYCFLEWIVTGVVPGDAHTYSITALATNTITGLASACTCSAEERYGP